MKIVFLDSHTTNAGDLPWIPISTLGTFVFHSNVVEEKSIIAHSLDADVLITNKAYIGREVMGRLPQLKLICVAATGYNSVDVAVAKEKGIPVCNVKGYSTAGVAQHVFGLILSLIHKVESYSSEVHHGDWSNQDFFSYQHQPWMELQNKTMGIFGFGTIGQEVGKIALAFGMKVIAHHKHPERDKMENVEMVDLEQLWNQSDIVSLHAPLNESTKGLINKANLEQMKPSSILINTGRGGLVQEKDLAEALKAGVIGAAGLDVLSTEPPSKDNPLLGCPNCLITPHQAWSSRESRSRLIEGIASNILAFQEGAPINVVN